MAGWSWSPSPHEANNLGNSAGDFYTNCSVTFHSMNIMVEIKTPVQVVEKNYETFKWLCLNKKIALHCSG